jgi:dihydroflavonol-4-reductase
MILITGATGHIGNVLVRKLLARGEKVRALILPGEDCTSLSDLKLDLVEGDVLDLSSLRRAFRGARIIYHLAGIISIMPGKGMAIKRVNVQGTRNVIRSAHEAGVSRLVYTSSIHALSREPHGATIDENSPFDPHHAISAYDLSKAEASLLVMDAACLGMNAVIVCPTGVIGPYDFRGSEMGQLIKDAMQSRPQFCIEGAYDFVDVRDVAEGMILACEKGRKGESYILSGERLKVESLMTIVQKISGFQPRMIKIPMALARIAALFTPIYYRLSKSKPRLTPYSLATVTSNSKISNAKAQRELGYRPRPLAESIADTVQWFREHQRPFAYEGK